MRRSLETAWPIDALWWRSSEPPQRAGRLQVEDVMVPLRVAREPEVPDPFVGKAERHRRSFSP